MRLLSVLLAWCWLAPLSAQDVPPDSAPGASPSPALGWPELRRFSGVALLGGLAYLVDAPARDALRRPADDPAFVDGAANFAYYYGQPGVAFLATGMWATGLATARPTLAVSGFRAMEAIAVSGTVTVLLKELFGRARPDVVPNTKDGWGEAAPFSGASNDFKAMPSGHATVAFAFATAVTQAVAERRPEYARRVGVTTFGLAGLVAWQRMYDDRHWLSDVTVGAGIGTVTALAIGRWHRTRRDDPIDRLFLRPVVMPLRDGVGLGLEVQTR